MLTGTALAFRGFGRVSCGLQSLSFAEMVVIAELVAERVRDRPEKRE